MQVFISYSRKDQSFVRDLAADLKAAGIDVWLDTEDLVTADEDRWRRSIVQGIRGSSALVVVLSPDAVESGPVERELTIAAETNRRIIPIVCRPCELPDGFQFELAGIQRIDFTELPRAEALEQLTRRVRTAPPATVASDGDLPLPAVADAPSSAAPGGGAPTRGPVPGPAAATVTPQPARVRALVVGSVVAVVLGLVGVIVLLAALSGGGGDDGADAGADTSAGTTADTAGPEVSTGAATESSPPDTAGTGDDASAADTPADRLVQELQGAYNARDWSTVRRMIEQPGNTDEHFVETYGTADGFPRLERAASVVLDRHVTGESTWELMGALVSLDYTADAQEITHVVCVEWAVDTQKGTAPFVPFVGSDGRSIDRLLDGWISPEAFRSTAEEYCASGPT